MVNPEILQSLAKLDPKLEPVISHYELKVESRDTEDVYFSLLRAINAQQLSVKAASTIFGRFLQLFENGYPAAFVLKDMDFEALRSVGLSRQKAGYVLNVANYFYENKLQDANWEQYKDEEIIEMLTTIKGVGKWTVQMILIFSMNRMDVFPIDDLVVRQSMIKLYEVNPEQKKKALYSELTQIAEKWKPYRSVASRFMWKMKDQKWIL
ncbi:MAG: DNA-3-methyladenine glycosylase family protein [Saprospiraceae bacterium]